MASRSDRSHGVGHAGEDIAAGFLEGRGCHVIGRNVRVGSDEIDLVIRDGRHVAAVEVKCSSNGDDSLLAVDDAKFERIVRSAAAYQGNISRIDIVAIDLRQEGVTIRWLRDLA